MEIGTQATTYLRQNYRQIKITRFGVREHIKARVLSWRMFHERIKEKKSSDKIGNKVIKNFSTINDG